jgi:4-amino-4-deoxy-L-arabinose transferase-like glycosyltransferase
MAESMSKETRALILIVSGACLLRITYVLFIADLSRENYWEYGEIVQNLHMGKGYSLYYDDGERYAYRATPMSVPFPSAYMMPGYVAFLYPFFFIGHLLTRNLLILVIQCVIGAAAAFLVYRFTDRYFGRKEALVASAVTAFLPEFVYAAGSYTPTVIFHLLFLAILPVLYRLLRDDAPRAAWVAGLLFGALVYVRPETSLFAVVFLIALLVRGRFREALRIGLVLVLLLLPWQVRNALVFHRWIPLTTSTGLNFFRGHNDLQLGTFADDRIIQGLRHLPSGSDFEPELSSLYFRSAGKYIAADPALEFGRAGNKFIQLWFRDSDDPRATNLLYILPWLLILSGAIVGMLRPGTWKKHWTLLLYPACSTIVALSFFVLPRYQTMMKVALIPFAASGIVAVWARVNRFRERKPIQMQ